MKTIERYVFGAFLSSFLLAFLVLSFVMTVGLMVQIVRYILDGMDMDLVGQFALVSFPETMQWTIPLALLVSSVLVFSRLSADSEVAAMRACGIHLATVMKWPVAFAVVCTALGMFVNNEIVPRGHEVRRNLKSRVTVGSGLSVLEPGHMIDDFPNVKVYFGAKEGNWLYDLMVLDYSNRNVDRMIRASKALVASEGRDITLDLYDMTVDPVDENNRSMARASRFQYRVKDALKESAYRRRDKDFRFFEMIGEIRARQAEVKATRRAGAAETADESAARRAERKLLRKDLSKMKVEFSKRFVFAMASICFVLAGVPLGIRAQRKESTVGMAISLCIALGYYLVTILMLSLDGKYAIHPEYLIWLPVAGCLAASVHLIRKHL